MVVINRLEDIEKIEDGGIRRYVHRLFLQCYETYTEGEKLKDFSLEAYGEVVIIENDEEFPNEPLFEYLLKDTVQGQTLYCGGILRNNEEIVSYIISERVLSNEQRRIIEEELC